MRNGNDLCLECGRCCNGVYFKSIKLLHGDRIDLFDVTYTPKYQGDFVLSSLPCQQLNPDNTCKIYEDRPRVCRDFQCVILKRYLAEDVDLDTALNMLEEDEKALYGSHGLMYNGKDTK